MSTEGEKRNEYLIVITEDGPYFLLGGIPLVRKTQVVSECGKPLAWKKGRRLGNGGVLYAVPQREFKSETLLRRHPLQGGFDGREIVEARPTAEGQVLLPGSSKIGLWRDERLCSQSGFCANRLGTIDQLAQQADDAYLRLLEIAMVER